MSLKEKLHKICDEYLNEYPFEINFDILETTGVIDINALLDVMICLSIKLERDNHREPLCKTMELMGRLRNVINCDDVPPLTYFETLYILAEAQVMNGLPRKNSNSHLYV